MRIAFLLESADISGGTYVIFEHSIRMMKNGHLVFIITENPLRKEQLFWHPEAEYLHWEIFDNVKELHFDIVIATWWGTAFNFYRLNADKYAYFVQSIESNFYPPKERALRHLANGTYLLPVNYITEATWIKKFLKLNYGHDAHLVLNGIRKEIYNQNDEVIFPRSEHKLRVLVEGHLGVWFKNTERTIEICKKSDADEIWLLTGSDVQIYEGVDRVVSKVPISHTARVYRSCDVLVKLSYVEGMFGPPLEMFHCGGTAIVYDVTGYDEYIKHDVNALVVETGDEDAVLNYINLLKRDKDLLRKLKRGALDTASQWPEWTTQANLFASALQLIIKEGREIDVVGMKAYCLYLKEIKEILDHELSKVFSTKTYRLSIKFSNIYHGLKKMHATLRQIGCRLGKRFLNLPT